MHDVLLNIYGSFTWLLPFLIVLTVLVFVHELGHYISARRHGVKITTFSIGFGPELFGFTDKVGTRWKFSLIPLGGYVQMYGDANAASQPDTDLQQSMSSEEFQLTANSKSVWKRIEISAAGPFANLLMTAILLAFVFWQVGQKTFDPILGEIKADSPAARAGLQTHDKIISINGKPIEKFRQIKYIVSKNPNQTLSFEINRQGALLTLPVTTESLQMSPTSTIGIIGAEPENIHHSFFSAAITAVSVTYNLAVDMLKMFGQLIIGKEDSSELGSLFSIAKTSHDMWEGGLYSLLFFMAILSLNLGVINLLPVPMLDGGHIFIYLIEAIRGKPLNEKLQDWIFKIGFGIVSAVMLYTLWNDVKRFSLLSYIGSFLKKLFGV